MAQAASRQPALPDLVDLTAQIEHDHKQPRAALHHRDRDIGQTLTTLRRRPIAQLTAWLDQVREIGQTRPGDTLEHAIHIIGLALILLGLLAGWGAAAGMFHYDGSHPVNVVNVLAVFVGAQWLLITMLILAVIPRTWLRWIPGAAAIQDVLRLLSPGRLAPWIAHLSPQETRERFIAALGTGRGKQQVYGRVQKWALVRWAQMFAVSFYIAALAWYLQRVFFSDLAFAWSTTLQVDAHTVHDISNALAWPWRGWLTDAAPSMSLVEKTRYFRLSEATPWAGARDVVKPSVFGGWWPFILMCMIVYGLVPRIVALTLAQWRLKRAVRTTLLHTPGVDQVLDRLNNEFVQTQAAPQRSGTNNHGRGAQDSATMYSPAPMPAHVRAIINWAGVPIEDDMATRWVIGQTSISESASSIPVLHAGGGRPLADDQRTIELAARGAATSPAMGTAIVVLVKSWEPPMLEVVDFLADLRDKLGPGTPIVVVPIALTPSGDLAHPDSSHLGQWQRKTAGTGDPWLSVAVLQEGGQ